MKLLVATTNKGKIYEYRYILSKVASREVVFLDQLPSIEDPIEDGDTYQANALIKANYYFDKFGIPVIADDSGVEIDALGGKPGVHTARYLPEYNNDGKFGKLHNLLMEAAPNKTKFEAKFFCCIAYKDKDQTKSFLAAEKGYITFPARGTNNHKYGYDPVFEIKDLGITLAEMTLEEKLEHSPRIFAAKKFLNWYS